jgi:outer membrane receptor protein involved in Fe transport
LVGDPKSPYDNNYNNFFPSIFITRKITETDELGLSYSKRVSRPRSRQLNPARYYSDTLNIRAGNPYLNPEFTNSLEFAYNKYWKGGSFSSAIFYRNSTDVIQRVNLVDNNGVATRTYDNIASTDDFGFEASAMAKIYKWWSLNANINLYMTNLNSDDPNFSNDGFNWFFRMNNTFNLSKSVSLQASGRYMGKRVIPQGSINPMYGMDLGLRYTFMDKKATLSLRLSDVFNTFRFDYNTVGSGFEEIGHRKWESRVAYITFAYNFGQASKKKKDRIKKDEGNDMQGGEMEGI